MSKHCLQNFDQPDDRNCVVRASEEEKWIIDRLKALIPGQDERLNPISIEPFRGLLKIHTADGLFFFKPLRDIHKHEQKLTCLLARLYPSNFPEVICADDEKGWLLMRDVGGDLLDDLYETKYFEETLCNFSRLQIECIKHAAALLACGCPDYRLESITLNIESFFEYLSTWEANTKEVDDIRKQIDLTILIERLTERCERVKEDCIPPTLCHGDLNLGNIFARYGQYVFIDWAEGYVGHPFFTPLEYFNIVKRDRGIEMANIPALRAAYLKPWSETLQLDTSHLVKLLDLSRPVGMLRIAMRYMEYYVSVEAIRKDLESATAYVTQVWSLIQRMNKVLSRGEELACFQ
jgi:Phosphotransferase enzyme family